MKVRPSVKPICA